jgi:hypothetical protein
MLENKLTKKAKEAIIRNIDDFYIKTINSVSKYSGKNNVGGKIRQSMGDLGEELTRMAWMEVAKLYAGITKPVEPKKGEKDKKECINKKGHTYEAHVDKHCYIGKKFVLAIESKSYLDACYYLRASSDFRLLKQYHNVHLICVVLSIEDAVKESSKKFIEDEGWIDATFILTDGKRSSAKPIWNKRFYKKLNYEKVGQLVEFLNNVFCNQLKKAK